MTQINLIEQIYPLNGDHRIQTVKPKWLTLTVQTCILSICTQALSPRI